MITVKQSPKFASQMAALSPTATGLAARKADQPSPIIFSNSFCQASMVIAEIILRKNGVSTTLTHIGNVL
jgi:hypothetical protein